MAKSRKPDPVPLVVDALLAAGFVAAGHTDTQQVRIPTARSPVFGAAGGELATFGGRARYRHPNGIRCTVGPRSTNFYRVERNEAAGLRGFETTDLDGIRAWIARLTDQSSSA
jgi:hypothetical protein